MSTAARPAESLADLLDAIGVPPQRIRMRPAPGTAAWPDVLACPDRRGRHCELVDGTLVEKPVGWRESYLAVWICGQLSAFVEATNAGAVTGEQGASRLDEDTVRIPDVAFTSWARLPGRRIPTEPLPEVVPDLAIEVLSEGNTPAEMRRKREDYFGAGVRLYWEVDPDARIVTVYTSAMQSAVRTEADFLDGGAVLPGFSLSVRDLFARLDLQGPPAPAPDGDA
jgi:Uma2 family endonuclease